MATIRDRIASLLYPAQAVCIACGSLRADHPTWPLCAACLKELSPLEPPFCPGCGRPGWATECPECIIRPQDALDGRIAAFAYAHTAAALVRALKYQNVVAAADILAFYMEKVLPAEPMDGLVPIPLYRFREKRRGFNQSEAICQAISSRTGLPVLNVAMRNRNTQTQTKLNTEGRIKNMQGAFCACMPVQGASLFLVDDVLTTGATATACATALKEAGARRVFFLAATRAMVGEDA